MPSCFVIMPLTTPPAVVNDYSGDIDHFVHVLEHLFSPAIQAAGYEIIRPIMRGADLIHAEIIKNLEESDLVLCDVSLLNANVFFELGIRTALDRPVALVKDDMTLTYPFDTSMINYHSYTSSLAPWSLQSEVAALRQHLQDSGDRADGRNSLWRYFGLTQRAGPAVIQNPLEEKIDLLVGEIEKLKTQTRPPVAARRSTSSDSNSDLWLDLARIERLPETTADGVRSTLSYAVQVADKSNAHFILHDFDSKHIVLDLGTFWLLGSDLAKIVAFGKRHKVEVVITGGVISR